LRQKKEGVAELVLVRLQQCSWLPNHQPLG
jgi:hypothetical protein